MASEALYAGLAAGAGALGGYMMETASTERKSRLADKLRKESEEREDAREVAREERRTARDAKKVEKEVVVPRDGSFVRQYRNSLGDTLKEEPLDSYEVDKIARKDQAEQLSLESLLRKRDVDDLEMRRKEQDLEDAPIDKSLERQVKRADIEYKRARANDPDNTTVGSGKPSKGAAPSNTPAGLADTLIDQYDAEIKALVDDDKLSATEARLAAIEAIKEAARRKVDARELFARQLSIYNQKKTP